MAWLPLCKHRWSRVSWDAVFRSGSTTERGRMKARDRLAPISPNQVMCVQFYCQLQVWHILYYTGKRKSLPVDTTCTGTNVTTDQTWK